MELALFALEMLVLGLGVGLISATLGLGGGILMVPAFVLLVDGMDAHTAKGTSLFIIIFVAGLNAWQQNKGDPIPWRLVALLVVGSIGGGYLGAWLTSPPVPETVVLWIFVLLMALTAVRAFFSRPVVVRAEGVERHDFLTALIGLATGITSGATGTGGGIVLVPLALTSGIESNARVVALSNLVMVATSIAGTIAHLRADQTVALPYTYGNVTFSIVPMVFLGAVLSSPFGRMLNQKLPQHTRQQLLGLLLIIVAIRLVFRAQAL